MKKLLLPMTLVSASLLAACGSSSDDDPTTVVDVAQGDDRFETLVTALTRADLVTTLQGEGPFTVFAPTDDAFAAFLEENSLSAEDLLGSDTLADVLTYHVLPIEANSTTAISAAESSTVNDTLLTTVQGDAVALSLSEGDLLVNEATVVQADVEADNGVIHAIDSVLTLPEKNALSDESKTITELVVALADAETNAEFGILKQAVVTAELDTVLDGDGPFTVFAPTDDAFDAALTALDITASELLAREDLADILLKHVLTKRVNSSVAVLADGANLVTANADGETVTIDASNGVMVDSATVTAADIYTSNGIVHQIDAVILTDAIEAALQAQ